MLSFSIKIHTFDIGVFKTVEKILPQQNIFTVNLQT